jgi:hypothetical protein
MNYRLTKLCLVGMLIISGGSAFGAAAAEQEQMDVREKHAAADCKDGACKRFNDRQASFIGRKELVAAVHVVYSAEGLEKENTKIYNARPQLFAPEGMGYHYPSNAPFTVDGDKR